MKTGIIIQARTGSQRFPNKIFAYLNGKFVIDHVIDEMKKINVPLVVAIPNTKPNDCLDNHLQKRNITVFRSYENDVLSRVYWAAVWHEFDIIIRVCGDSPKMKAKDVFENLSKFVREKQRRMIWGQSSWIFNLEMIREVEMNSPEPNDREHCGFHYMSKTIDYSEDIERLNNNIIKNDDNE